MQNIADLLGPNENLATFGERTGIKISGVSRTGSKSDVCHGVPITVGPLLFLVYVNDMVSSCPNMQLIDPLR